MKRPTCPCLLSTDIKDVHHHTWPCSKHFLPQIILFRIFDFEHFWSQRILLRVLDKLEVENLPPEDRVTGIIGLIKTTLKKTQNNLEIHKVSEMISEKGRKKDRQWKDTK